ncbi:MAG: lipopolysaccharide biosynthesis protein [Cytophagaceae bacterium]|nr:lipopolysaccharide biosynthesis protein [Cytophagaceae bacterium]
MDPLLIIRLLRQYAPLLVLIPFLTAGTVYFVTRDQPRLFVSHATLYTGLSSGYSLMSAEQRAQMDYSAVNNAFENILTTLTSKESLRQVGIGLLVQDLESGKTDPVTLSVSGFRTRRGPGEEVSPENDLIRIQQTLDSLSLSPGSNPVKNLLLVPNSYYSADLIGKKLKAERKRDSDMLAIEYESDDADVAQRTLNLAIQVFNRRYASFQNSETTPVVGYYEGKVQKAKTRLSEAERKLQAFLVAHQVLDLDEESKSISATRETTAAEYNQELMRNKAAKAAMEVLNRRMGPRGNALTASSELKEAQAQLAEAGSKLANARINGQPKNAVDLLQQRVDQASDELKESARQYYTATNSPESIPQQTLLSEWLTKIIDYEESTARLGVYKEMFNEYRNRTAEYTPLGSELRQLNRELTLAEKEYLELEQTLNQANTRQQNVSIEGALGVLDAPDFPQEPQPSKRWLYVALGFFAGLFLTLFLIALRYWFDQRILSPDQAETLIGRPVAAIFPFVARFSYHSKPSRAALSMFEQLCGAINVELFAKQSGRTHQPSIISLFSMRSRQGKTWVGISVARTYREAGQRVAYCYPHKRGSFQSVEQEGISFLPYLLRGNFMNVMDLDGLFDGAHNFDPYLYDTILVELPALINTALPVYLINQSRVSLLVTDASSIWQRTDRKLLNMYLKVANHTVLTVLNRVRGDFIDTPDSHDTALKAGVADRSLEYAQR